MEKRTPEISFERYADDIVVHCYTIKHALRLLEAIKKRLKECKLELNSEKPKIVYCRRNQKYHPPFKVYYQKFDFLGFTFKPRVVKERGKIKLGFTPAISSKSISRIGQLLKLKIRGWINYYGKFRMSEMRKLFRLLHLRIAKWVRNKYKRFRRKHWFFAYKYLQGIAKSYPNLFEHWQYESFRP